MLNRIMGVLEKNNAFNEEDYEFVKYGLYSGFLQIINVAAFFLVGFLFNMVFESIGFVLIYGLLRSFAGGYHAKTALKCFVLSILLITVVLGLQKTLVLYSIQNYLLIVSCLVIIFLSPVEDVNKPLNSKEVSLFKKISMAFLAIILALLTVQFKNSMAISHLIIISITAVSLLQIIGYIKNRLML